MMRRIMTMNDEIMITIPMKRYEELLKAEAKLQFLKAYVSHEVYATNDIKYYLGIKDEEKNNDIS
jgi:hypothetical protein